MHSNVLYCIVLYCINTMQYCICTIHVLLQNPIQYLKLDMVSDFCTDFYCIRLLYNIYKSDSSLTILRFVGFHKFLSVPLFCYTLVIKPIQILVLLCKCNKSRLSYSFLNKCICRLWCEIVSVIGLLLIYSSK